MLSELEQMEALIRFYFGVDCRKVDEDEVAFLWGQLEFALAFTGKVKKLKKG